jgi:hypothetical protein
MSDGAKEVPREPTEAMIDEAFFVYEGMLPGNFSSEVARMWRAMYDAAPSAQSTDYAKARALERWVRAWRLYQRTDADTALDAYEEADKAALALVPEEGEKGEQT